MTRGMSDNITSLLEKYAAKPLHRQPETDAQEPLQDEVIYQACGLDKTGDRQTGIRIHDSNGTIELISYAYVMRVICTSHQFLSLICTDGIVTFEGRNLTALIELIQDGKIRSLHCFHPKQYPEPASGQPVILRIERSSRQEIQAQL